MTSASWAPPSTPAHELTEESLAAFLASFYAKARGDAELGPIFAAAIADDGWAAHLARIQDFWSSLLFRTGRYKGNPFAAHLGKAIRPAHFSRWLALFDATAAEHFHPDLAAALSERAHRIGDSLRGGLFLDSSGDANRSGRARTNPVPLRQNARRAGG